MSKTVMIVEDNELNMKLFHDLLEAHGYHPIGTRDGMEALDLARKHRPDLILMDIQLPEVSGLEMTKWLKEDPELKSIPVVAVTAFAMKGDEERIRENRSHQQAARFGEEAERIDRRNTVASSQRYDVRAMEVQEGVRITSSRHSVYGCTPSQPSESPRPCEAPTTARSRNLYPLNA